MTPRLALLELAWSSLFACSTPTETSCQDKPNECKPGAPVFVMEAGSRISGTVVKTPDGADDSFVYVTKPGIEQPQAMLPRGVFLNPVTSDAGVKPTRPSQAKPFLAALANDFNF